MDSIKSLLGANEKAIRAIERELLEIKAQLRKRNADNVLDLLEKRINELQVRGRELLAQRKLLETRLKKEPAKVIQFRQPGQDKKKKLLREVGRSWVKVG